MTLRSQLTLGYSTVFALMLAIAGVTYLTEAWRTENRSRLEHTQEVIGAAREIAALFLSMQSGLRGFLITGSDVPLATYETAAGAYERKIAALKELVSDDRGAVERLEAIDDLVERWQRLTAEPAIAEHRQSGAAGDSMERVRAMVLTGTGMMDDLLARVAAFVEAQTEILEERQESSRAAAARQQSAVALGTGVAIALGVVAMLWLSRRVLRQVGGEPATIAGIADQIARGNLDLALEGGAAGGTGIRAAIGAMLLSLRENRDLTGRQDWLKTGLARLDDAMRGDQDVASLASKVISEIATRLDAQVGAFYLAREGDEPCFTLLATYAYRKRKNVSNAFRPGEGLVGQAGLEKQQILVKNVPEDYCTVTSGLGERAPRFLCVTPFQHEGRVKGVVEVGTLHEMPDFHLEYLEQAMASLAVAVETAQARQKLAEALEGSQRLTEELQSQQEELRTTNEELEEQAQRLKESEQRLKIQQEELQVANEELEEKNELLERQTREVELARNEIETKAQELGVASRYKSEFLANMSHELRTPLNSLLLLARSLAENKEGNLTAQQVEFAEIIYDSGSDLLSLINEILDLSKIEAGRMELEPVEVPLRALAESMRSSFQHLADQKGLSLSVELGELSGEAITTDQRRLEQILRNLLSNALKFTEAGGITLRFGPPAPGTDLSRSGLAGPGTLAIAVSDTGIGIPPDAQARIFEAFQQSDGSTSRRYGGTGLGLSISRELARLLGGEIQVQSQPGKGSTFTLYLPSAGPRPREAPPALPPAVAPPSPRAASAQPVPDDRETLAQGESAILVIEDDPTFARLLGERCRAKGFKFLAASSGEAGLDLARRHLPMGVILDIRLPGIDGWAVLSALKADTRTRHIPVHVVTVGDGALDGLQRGAIGQLIKPVSPEDIDDAFRKLAAFADQRPRRVLVIEDDPLQRREIVETIAEDGVEVEEVSSAAQALEALRAGRYHCVILDLGLPEADGMQLLEALHREHAELPPVIVYTARDLTPEETLRLREFAESIVLKDVRSRERLLDEVSLFLHRVVTDMPEAKRQIIKSIYDGDSVLQDRKVLLVDDDMRGSFAVARLLGEHGVKTLKAESGQKALHLLDREPHVDLVLMDIMMPGVDGYETMRRIRADERFKSLPIIALTAKAMKDDRERCIAAGANDYLPKPVDAARLLSMMRVWLYSARPH